MEQFSLMISLLILVSAYGENKEPLPNVLIRRIPPNVMKKIEENSSYYEKQVVAGVKERCSKYGTNESYDNMISAGNQFEHCITNLVNMNVLHSEIEKAKPIGELDTVFRKYCRKSPVLRNCATNLTEAIEPCLSHEEQDTKVAINNVIDALISFICYKEGDRIALFIAEGGEECLKSKEDNILDYCLNTTTTNNILSESGELPTLRLGQPECRDINSIHKCILGYLEQCTQPTTANIIDSMIKIAKKVTPCQEYVEQTSEAVHLASSYIILAISAALQVFLLSR